MLILWIWFCRTLFFSLFFCSLLLWFDAYLYCYGTSLMAQMVKHLPTVQKNWVRSLGWEDPLEKGMATQSSILPGKSHGRRSLVGYSPWGHKELDMTEWLHFLTFWLFIVMISSFFFFICIYVLELWFVITMWLLNSSLFTYALLS